MTELCDRIVNPLLLVRRICVVANNVINEKDVKLQKQSAVQLDLFADYEAIKKQEAEQNEELKKERRVQETLLDIKKKFGNNAILKGLDFSEGATTRERNNQIGGHKA
jgi:DNA polymerase V